MSTVPSQRLRLVFWETTAGCNLECVHCRRLEVAHELMKSDLTTEEGCRLIDQIAETARPILVFSGGEPLMRPDLFDLARHAKARDLLIALATNGTMIDEPMARRIADAGFDRVSISLDGADAATHDKFRGQAGSFDRAMQALHRLREHGVPTQVNCTIARHDKDQLHDLVALTEEVGAVALHYFLLVPVGCGEEIAEDQMLDTDEVEARLLQIYEIEQNTDLQIKATCAPHYYRVVRQKARDARRSAAHGEGEATLVAAEPSGVPSKGHPGGHPHGGGTLHSHTKGCLAGTSVCFVSHEGKVFPCGYLPAEAGDIRRQHFREVWEQSQVFGDLRDPSRLTGKCGACEFVRVCGGCRARAFYEYGDFLAEEPFCQYQPTHRDHHRAKDNT